jgi:uncharacterized membrane protein
MRQFLTSSLLWFSAMGCGLIAGVYFTFSAFVMTSLGRIDPAAGIAAMNSINLVILRSLFMPLFLGTTLAGAALALLTVFRWGESGAIAMLAGGVIYVLGMFFVTIIFNVPLNDALAAVDPSTAQGASLWATYQQAWTFWNHVRTVASLAASVLFTLAIAAK